MKQKAIIGIGILGLIAFIFYKSTAQPDVDISNAGKIEAGAAIVEITLPDTLPVNAQIGKRVFEAKCAVCHGANAVGQEGTAPPLVFKTYEPKHHGDEAFQRAAALGVRSHHWPFGNMPPVEGLTRGDVAMIVAYIRELQQTNGIQ